MRTITKHSVKFFTIIILSAVFISSCKKDDAAAPGAPAPHLWKVYQVDANTLDTFVKTEYFYDNAKRISRMELSSPNPLPTLSSFPQNEQSTLLYHGADTLPYRIQTSGNFPQNDAFNVDYFMNYDNNGRLVRDSFYWFQSNGGMPDIFTRSANISYGNYIIRHSLTSTSLLGSTTPSFTTTLDSITVSGNNFISSKRYEYDENGALSTIFSTSISYNSNLISLLHSINFFSLQTSDYIISEQWGQPFPSNNLAASIDQTILYDNTGLTGNFHAIANYVFSSDGLTSEMHVTVNSQIGTRHYKYVFLYKNI